MTPDTFTLRQLAPAKRRRWLVPMLVALGLVVVLVAGITVWLLMRPAPEPTPEQAAVSACEDGLRNLLHSPTTAQFSGVHTNLLATGHWYMTGNVDHQNDFGAQVRDRWACDASPDGAGGWVPLPTINQP